MGKREAKRLRPGDRVLYGPHRRVQDCWWTREGEVEAVSEQGAIFLADGEVVVYSNVIDWWRGNGPSWLYAAWDA